MSKGYFQYFLLLLLLLLVQQKVIFYLKLYNILRIKPIKNWKEQEKKILAELTADIVEGEGIPRWA